MVRLHCPPKRAVRGDGCEQEVPRLISEPTRPLKVRIDACCGVAPERSVRSNQRVDLGGRQLDTLIAQRRQGADRITQEFQTVFLVGHQATDDHLNGSQRHACTSGGRSRLLRIFVCVRWRRGQSQGCSMTASTSLAETQPSSRRHGLFRRVWRTVPPETDRCRRAQDRASHQSGSSVPLARPVGVRLAPKA